MAASRTSGPSTGNIREFPLPVVWMNERTRKLCLPPLVETNAQVVKCNVIEVETFAFGSVHPNQLRREVQYLTELCFLFPDLFLSRLALGDIGHRPDKLAMAGCILYSVSY